MKTTTNTKEKKVTIIAGWLQQAFREFGRVTVEEVEAWSYVVSHPPQMEDGCPQFTLEDGLTVAQLAELPLDEMATALAILRGINTPNDPTSLGRRKCSACGQWQPLEEFTGYQIWCKSCRGYYNSFRYR